jgi:hypothetical protein
MLIVQVSALVNYNNNSISTSYQEGQIIRGKINVSFDSESSEGVITSNFGGRISLIELLMKNKLEEGIGYDCSTKNCVVEYAPNQTIDSLYINTGEQRVVGFILNGKEVVANSIELNILSDTGPSCTRQLRVNLLDKGDYYIQSSKTTGGMCTKRYSPCFNRNLGRYSPALITTNPFCQKISLPPAPSYSLGAKVTRFMGGKLKMELYDPTGYDRFGACDLPSPTETVSEIECIVEHTSMKTGEYLVCIAADALDPGEFEINSEQREEICGTSQIGSEEFTRDFEIFATGLEFDSPEIEINDDVFLELNNIFLTDYLNDYIYDVYDGDCSEGCAVPLTLSGISQALNFENPEVSYIVKDGTILASRDVSLFEKKNATITTGELLLDLKYIGFEIPIDTEENNFSLFINGELIFEEALNISEGFSFGIYPRVALIGVDTAFKVETDEEIVNSVWNFGDGVTSSSDSDRIIHKYGAAGEYEMEIELTRKDGVKAVKTFMVIAGNPRESAEKLIEKSEEEILSLEEQVDQFPGWVRSTIKDKVGLGELNVTIGELKENFESSFSDEEYEEIVDSLLGLNIPDTIAIRESKTFPLSVGFDKMDTFYIESISGGEGEEIEVKTKIIDWLNRYYDVDIRQEVIARSGDSGEEDILSKFRIRMRPKREFLDGAYLIIDYTKEGLAFKENYSENSVNSGTYIPVFDSAEIEFLVPGFIEVSDLGVYVSPDISALALEKAKKEFPSGTIIWVVGGIVVLLIIYIVVKEILKRYSEKSLFKSPDQLYNMVTFIYNARKSRINDQDIKKKLAGRGWNSRQIKYAFKKLEGRAAAFVLRPFEQKKVMREIQKRKGQK